MLSNVISKSGNSVASYQQSLAQENIVSVLAVLIAIISQRLALWSNNGLKSVKTTRKPQTGFRQTPRNALRVHPQSRKMVAVII